ncbi:MAG: vitamin K epoxide reductase family protein [Actinomycetota bacterium]
MTPRWGPRVSFALALAAVAVSTYLTIAHFTSPDVLACSSNGTIDCAKVTTSAESEFLGMPVAALGLVWAVAMAALCSPPAWRSPATWVRVARIALASAGILFVLWLVYAELFIIHAICLWCTAMHVLAFSLFVVVLMFGSSDASEAREY